eukprot:7359461-Prymnesium_polylepis.2
MAQFLILPLTMAVHLSPAWRPSVLASPRVSAASMRLSTVADRTEYRALVKSTKGCERVVVIEFLSGECRGCKKMQPKLKKLSQKWPAVSWTKLYYEGNHDLFKSRGVRQVPHFEILANGTAVEAFACVSGAEPPNSRQATPRLRPGT